MKNIGRNIVEEMFRYQNKGPTEIGKIFGVTRHAIWKRIVRWGIIKCYNDMNWLREMHHAKLLTVRDMAKLAHCKEYTIGQKMRQFGIENITFNR